MRFLVSGFLLSFMFLASVAVEEHERFLGIFFPRQTTTQTPLETTTTKQSLIESILEFLFGVQIQPPTTSPSKTTTSTRPTSTSTMTSTTTTSTTTGSRETIEIIDPYLGLVEREYLLYLPSTTTGSRETIEIIDPYLG